MKMTQLWPSSLPILPLFLIYVQSNNLHSPLFKKQTEDTNTMLEQIKLLDKKHMKNIHHLKEQHLKDIHHLKEQYLKHICCLEEQHLKYICYLEGEKSGMKGQIKNISADNQHLEEEVNSLREAMGDTTDYLVYGVCPSFFS
jgi:hypothetical protein